MPSLFALCRVDDRIEAKRVAVAQPVQAKIEAVFEEQARAFLEGVDEEVPFGSDWKPDDDQIIVMDTPGEAVAVAQSMGNPLSLSVIHRERFLQEHIVALAAPSGDGAGQRVLLQLFTAQQMLSRRFTLMMSGDTFNELTDPAFTLASGLAAIIEGEKLKFKSFANVKRIQGFRLA